MLKKEFARMIEELDYDVEPVYVKNGGDNMYYDTLNSEQQISFLIKPIIEVLSKKQVVN